MSPTLFNTFFVPGYDYITIYPDALSPYRFYCFKSHPRLGTTKDPANNKELPNLRFTVYRNPEDAKQVQSGTLLLTTDLGLTSTEENAIRSGIRKHVLSSDYLADMKRYYPDAYERIRSDAKVVDTTVALKDSDYRKVVDEKSITLSTLQPTDGNVELELVQPRDAEGDTGEKHYMLYQTPQHKPNLNGNFSSSFSASFADLATEAMLDCLKKGYTISNGKQIPLQAIVRYELTVPFLVPALEADVSVDMTQVYASLLDELHIPYTFESHKVIVDRNYRFTEHRYEKGVINDALKRIGRVNDRGIIIDLGDYSALGNSIGGDEVSEKIMDSLVDAICGSLLSQMFTVNPEPSSSGQTESGNENAKEKENLGKVSYSIREFRGDWTDINFSLRKRQILNLTLPANGGLSAVVPKSLEDEIITEVDLSHLEMGRRQVQLSCQRNPNPDQIECVEMLCKCDPDDVRFKNKYNEPKSLMFKKGDEEVKYFRYYYAKKSDGSYETRFSYQTRIHFVGRPPSDWTPEVWVDTDNMKLSYENIGFLNVDLEVLDVDWNMVDKVFVDISYPAVKDKPDTAKTLVFKEDTPQKWGCYRYGNKSNQYQYSIRFKDKDGFEYPKDPKVLTSTNAKLSIRDLYGGQPMAATFRVSFLPEQVSMVSLDIYYKDERLRIDRKYPYTFTSPGSYEWKMYLQEGACEKIHYVYEVVYQDGYTDRHEFDASGRNPDIRAFVAPARIVSKPAPQVQNQENVLMIIADGLFADEKWTTAMVTVKYEDPENGIFLNKPVLLNRSKTNETVSVNCPGNAFKPFLCKATLLAASDPNHPTVLPETSCTGFYNIVPPTD